MVSHCFVGPRLFSANTWMCPGNSIGEFSAPFPSPAGSVKVWDPRQKDEPVACMEPAEGEMRRDCWTVAFGELINPCNSFGPPLSVLPIFPESPTFC